MILMKSGIYRTLSFGLAAFLNCCMGYAQNKELKLLLNADGSEYIKTTFTAQNWIRFSENNPGSTVNSQKETHTFDIGLRRTRVQLFGKIHPKVFFYTQFGINNFGYNSERKPALFFHDVIAEYHFHKTVHVGYGLTGWSGFSRFSSPSISTFSGLDAPLFLQTTNDVNDQFLRKLSVYAKGDIGKVQYRMALTKPMDANKGAGANVPIGQDASFAKTPPKLQVQGYFQYQFDEMENHISPYTVGSYLGKKKVTAIGLGFIQQNQTTWRTQNNDTLFEQMLLGGLDVYIDRPLNKEKNNVFNLYGGIFYSYLGKNYLRTVGPMNPTDSKGFSSLSGPGTSYPAIGTGKSGLIVLSYLLKKGFLIKEENGRLMPYLGVHSMDYDKLNELVFTYDAGLNWLIDGHRSKMTLGYQLRPILMQNSTGEVKHTQNRSLLILQFQIAI